MLHRAIGLSLKIKWPLQVQIKTTLSRVDPLRHHTRRTPRVARDAADQKEDFNCPIAYVFYVLAPI